MSTVQFGRRLGGGELVGKLEGGLGVCIEAAAAAERSFKPGI